MEVRTFSHIGKKNSQEDAFYISPDQRLFLVCDGVGGSQHGGFASKGVVDHIHELYIKILDNESEINLKELVLSASQYLHEQNILKGLNASTTIAIAYLNDSNLQLTHLGDTKVIVIFKSRKTYWSSKDHSLVQELYDVGIICDEEAMRVHPMRNRITKALNSESEVLIEDIVVSNIVGLQEEDCILICSDGVLESFTTSGLVNFFLKENRDTKDCFDQLNDICQASSKDNSTCILIRI